jgi:hypothetical protein
MHEIVHDLTLFVNLIPALLRTKALSASLKTERRPHGLQQLLRRLFATQMGYASLLLWYSGLWQVMSANQRFRHKTPQSAVPFRAASSF